MTDIVKPHSFEVALNNLKELAEQTPSDIGLDKVDSEAGLFGWFDHKVTGDELNKITTQVQGYLVGFNNLHLKEIKEVQQIYNVLESLDKEYIPAILAAVKAAETASDQAKRAQKDISKLIEAHKKSIKVLEQHKERLDRLQHLENIDEIWASSKELEKELKSFKSNFSETEKKVEDLKKSIASVQKYAETLMDQEHLDDIDEMWERVGQDEESLSELRLLIENVTERLDSCANSIGSIAEEQERIVGQKHILEIDTLYADVDEAKESINTLKEENEKAFEQIQSLEETIAKERDENNNTVETMRKNLFIAYIVAGSGTVIGVLGIILNLVGVL